MEVVLFFIIAFSVYLLSGVILICIGRFMSARNYDVSVDELDEIALAPVLNTLSILVCVFMLVGRILSSPLILLRDNLNKRERKEKLKKLIKPQ